MIAIWLIISIILKKSPSEVLSNTFSKIPTPSTSALQQELAEKDSIIELLNKKIQSYEGSGSYKRGIVIVDSPTLNMRSGPSLSSDVVLRIPANAEVQILYYDTQTYYLNSVAGKWCRIKYAGTEGWAWGNFINEI